MDTIRTSQARSICIYELIHNPPVTPLQWTNFRLESELLEVLQQVRERDGIPMSEQVRRVIRVGLKEKGTTVKAERKRVAPRRRP